MLCITFLLFMTISNWLTYRPSSAIRDIRSIASKYTLEQQQKIVDLHNRLRQSVIPPASDMMYMQWDDSHAGDAQYWADTCKTDHGFPDSNSRHAGQNMYFGQDITGIEAIKLWYNETTLYNYFDNSCQANQQCGHYTQVAWASSKLVGCGYAKCSTGYTHVICNYYPGGNIVMDVRSGKIKLPYKQGSSCSQCESVDGGLCSNKLCVTKDICKKNSQLQCKCDLKCFNCGKFDQDSCSCKCADAWDGLDCQKICVNENVQCEKMYLRLPCTDSQKNDCREKCQMCKRANPKKPENLCCGGKVCPNGVLNDHTCECEASKIESSISPSAVRPNLASTRGISGTCFLFLLIASVQTVL